MIQSSHHCGMIRSLKISVPARMLLTRIIEPTKPVRIETPMMERERHIPPGGRSAGSTRDITMSTRICSLVRSRCGAAKKVEMNSPYSVSSIRPTIEGNQNIRRITSALIPIAITATTRTASTQRMRTSHPLSRKIRRMQRRLNGLRRRALSLVLSMSGPELADRVRAELRQVLPRQIDARSSTIPGRSRRP